MAQKVLPSTTAPQNLKPQNEKHLQARARQERVYLVERRVWRAVVLWWRAIARWTARGMGCFGFETACLQTQRGFQSALVVSGTSPVDPLEAAEPKSTQIGASVSLLKNVSLTWRAALSLYLGVPACIEPLRGHLFFQGTSCLLASRATAGSVYFQGVETMAELVQSKVK